MVPTYAKLWKGINSDPGNFVAETREGIERVKRGNYAFFMNAVAIEYIIERDNDLIQVGGLLDSKEYGIAMKKGSYMMKMIDVAILQMQESGVLKTLKHPWWSSNTLLCRPFSIELHAYCGCMLFIETINVQSNSELVTERYGS